MDKNQTVNARKENGKMEMKTLSKSQSGRARGGNGGNSEVPGKEEENQVGLSGWLSGG